MLVTSQDYASQPINANNQRTAFLYISVATNQPTNQSMSGFPSLQLPLSAALPSVVSQLEDFSVRPFPAPPPSRASQPGGLSQPTIHLLVDRTKWMNYKTIGPIGLIACMTHWTKTSKVSSDAFFHRIDVVCFRAYMYTFSSGRSHGCYLSASQAIGKEIPVSSHSRCLFWDATTLI